jgi:hypothetical protein
MMRSGLVVVVVVAALVAVAPKPLGQRPRTPQPTAASFRTLCLSANARFQRAGPRLAICVATWGPNGITAGKSAFTRGTPKASRASALKTDSIAGLANVAPQPPRPARDHPAHMASSAGRAVENLRSRDNLSAPSRKVLRICNGHGPCPALRPANRVLPRAFGRARRRRTDDRGF